MSDYRETVQKLRNEVRGLRGCFNFDEWSIREAIGNTNYSVAMLHFQHIEESLTLLTEQDAELARLRDSLVAANEKLIRAEHNNDAAIAGSVETQARYDVLWEELATLRAENAKLRRAPETQEQPHTHKCVRWQAYTYGGVTDREFLPSCNCRQEPSR